MDLLWSTICYGSRFVMDLLWTTICYGPRFVLDHDLLWICYEPRFVLDRVDVWQVVRIVGRYLCISNSWPTWRPCRKWPVRTGPDMGTRFVAQRFMTRSEAQTHLVAQRTVAHYWQSTRGLTRRGTCGLLSRWQTTRWLQTSLPAPWLHASWPTWWLGKRTRAHTHTKAQTDR